MVAPLLALGLIGTATAVAGGVGGGLLGRNKRRPQYVEPTDPEFSDYLRQQAMGNGPSAAAAMGRMQSEEARRSAMSLAASGQGASPAAARYGALYANAAAQAGIAQNTELARIEEMRAAQGLYQQDRQFATGQRSMYEQQRYADESARAARRQQMFQQTMQGVGSAWGGALQANAAAQLQTQELAQRQQVIDRGGNPYGGGGGPYTSDRSAKEDIRPIDYDDMGTAPGTTADSPLDRIRALYSMGPTKLTPAGERAAGYVGTQDPGAPVGGLYTNTPANASPGLQAFGVPSMWDEAGNPTELSMYRPAGTTEATANATARRLADAQAWDRDHGRAWGGLPRGSGSMFPDAGQPMFSDMTTKEVPLPFAGSQEPAAAARAFGELEPSVYRYKPEAAARMAANYAELRRPRVGVMAQDLARTPAGREAVYRDPGSDKLAIDRDKAIGLSLAATADIERRLRQLEANRKAPLYAGR